MFYSITLASPHYNVTKIGHAYIFLSFKQTFRAIQTKPSFDSIILPTWRK